MFFPKAFQRIINWIARSKVSVTGAVIVSILFPVLIVSFAFDLLGLIRNPYFGFLLYVVMAPLFVLGIILVLLGAIFLPGKEDLGIYAVEYLKEQLSRPGRFTRVRNLIYFTIAITLLSVFVIGIVSYSSFRYTDSTSFCGQFCHSVMKPQYVAYKNSPHSQVACVECHFGKDASLSERSKFTGLRQLLAVATQSYSRPIMSPIYSLRPGRKTCEECHLPEKFHGFILYSKDHFLPDKENTHVQTVLLMKVGSGDLKGQKAHGIHWHVSQAQQIYFQYADKAQNVITQLRIVEKGKKDRVFEPIKALHNPAISVSSQDLNKNGGLRKMDCIDCHNRPTHIFLSPDEALDQKLAANLIPRFLPYIKKQALSAITKKYDSVEEARLQISRQLQQWYREHYPELLHTDGILLGKAIQGAIQAYEENVFPEMNVTWGTYKNFIGHENDSGCFRCHGKLKEVETGKVISSDCNLCHIVLAEKMENPDVLRILRGK